ncbi:MAG: DNA polymerase IV [Spirochaetaceae bacterium]|nr:DNA polymerase IV [Spirochaetaceae bacterium]
MASLFFHADIDCFFAAVEKLDNPALKDEPVIVGGDSARSVVSTCSYETRKFGVHSGMPISKAKRLCPKAHVLPVRMARYHEVSMTIMKILKSYTPHFQQISIDEGFLDMSGMELVLGTPQVIAKKIKDEVFEKTNLTISIGIARTKYFAKLASDVNKPNGLFQITEDAEKTFIRNMPMNKIWGLGKKTIEKLRANGILDTEMLFQLNLETLQKILGNHRGSFLFSILTANTESFFSDISQSHSISTERTFEYDIVHTEIVEQFLFQMSCELMYRLVSENLFSNTLSVKIRYADFNTTTIQSTDISIIDTLTIYTEVKKLFYQRYERGNPIRLLGIAALKVQEKNDTHEFALFDEVNDSKAEKKKCIEKAAFEIAKKHGKSILTRARLLDTSTDT